MSKDIYKDKIQEIPESKYFVEPPITPCGVKSPATKLLNVPKGVLLINSIFHWSVLASFVLDLKYHYFEA